jgi:hypothetical protein
VTGRSVAVMADRNLRVAGARMLTHLARTGVVRSYVVHACSVRVTELA